jgi:hypothetical protein
MKQPPGVHPPALSVTPAQLAAAQRWPIGQPVIVRMTDGTQTLTTTRSHPWKLGSTWVLLLEGLSGSYPLARVQDDGGGA